MNDSLDPLEIQFEMDTQPFADAMRELADLSDADIHDPPSGKRPKGYPDRLIEHRDARERALSAWQQAKGS